MKQNTQQKKNTLLKCKKCGVLIGLSHKPNQKLDLEMLKKYRHKFVPSYRGLCEKCLKEVSADEKRGKSFLKNLGHGKNIHQIEAEEEEEEEYDDEELEEEEEEEEIEGFLDQETIARITGEQLRKLEY